MDSFRKKQLLGVGSFGKVWLCSIDNGNSQLCAAKFLKQDADRDSLGRFCREVRLLSDMRHPHIMKVLTRQIHTKPYFYMMPYYRTSLSNELESIVGNENRIRAIFEAILDGMEYAHSKGIIHRDLKSKNILLNNDNDVVISDFGLGRAVDSASTRLTETGDQMGTPFYMAPEQYDNAKNTDERTDIYALGRILYELYTGPLNAAVQDTTSLPPAVALIVKQCTQADPDSRYQSVVDLKRAWAELFELDTQSSEIDELATLRSELSVSGTINNGDLDRLLMLMARHGDDPEILHETIMELSPEAIDTLYRIDSDIVSRLIEDFAEYAMAESWPFSYTDRIGEKCHQIFNTLHAYDIRSKLVICTMVVGTSHNRWHVLGIFSSLMEKIKEPGEVMTLSERLKNIDHDTRQLASEYVDINEIHRRLRPFFQ